MPKCIYRYDLPYQPANYKPFVYEICFKPKDTNHKDYGKRYIGSLYRNNTSSGTAHPDFFWVEDGYYTSSYPIQVLLNEHGPESFEVVYVTSFTTKQETYDYEKERLIETNAARNPMYFNQHNNNGPANSLTRKSVMKSAKTKKKKRDKMIVNDSKRFEEIEAARKEKERKTKEERFFKRHGVPYFRSTDNLYSYEYFFSLRHRYKIETWPTFSHFVADMGLRPSKGYLFRHDLNKPYSKENCYWKIATKSKLRTLPTPRRKRPQETIDKIKRHKRTAYSNREAANSVEFVSVFREALKGQS